MIACKLIIIMIRDYFRLFPSRRKIAYNRIIVTRFADGLSLQLDSVTSPCGQSNRPRQSVSPSLPGHSLAGWPGRPATQAEPESLARSRHSGCHTGRAGARRRPATGQSRGQPLPGSAALATPSQAVTVTGRDWHRDGDWDSDSESRRGPPASLPVSLPGPGSAANQ